MGSCDSDSPDLMIQFKGIQGLTRGVPVSIRMHAAEIFSTIGFET